MKNGWLLLTIAVFIIVLMLGWQVFQGQELAYEITGLCGWGISFTIDGFRAIFCILTAFAWLLTTLAAPERTSQIYRPWYSLFSFLTLVSTLGVFLSADFFTTYIFFEIMTFSSYAMIIQEGDTKALQGGAVYLTFGIVGGLAILLGMAGLYQLMGTLEFSQLLQAREQIVDQGTLWVSGLLIFFGFAVKSGVFPVHITLAPAYDGAPAAVSAVLSSILSKTGVYGLIVVSVYVFGNQPSWGLLTLGFGLMTMYAGAILALFNTQLKRILAYSSMSQIGFILLGIGMQNLLGAHNAFAVRGSLLHMVNHSLIKLVFFMVVGILATGMPNLDLNTLRGYGKGKPVLHLSFLLGALGIMGVPFFNGYISKTLLHESIVVYLHDLEALGISLTTFKIIEVLFIVAGGLTVAYITKVYVAIFWDKPHSKNSKRQVYMGKASVITLLAAAICLPILGSLPWLMETLADFGESFMLGWPLDHPVEYLAWINLKGAVYSLAIGALVYLGFVRTYLLRIDEGKDNIYLYRWPQSLDLTEGFYKPLLLRGLPWAGMAIAQIFYQVGGKLYSIMMKMIFWGFHLARVIFNIADKAQHGLKMLTKILIYFADRLFDIVEISIGSFIHWVQYIAERLSGKKTTYVRYIDKRENWQHFFAELNKKANNKKAGPMAQFDKKEKQNVRQSIEGSISYSLLLFGIGLIITMLYLLNL